MSLIAITNLVDDKLRSTVLGSELADPQVRDRAIGQAVVHVSIDAPQRLWADVAMDSGVAPLPTGEQGWVDGRSVLDAVEYPIGQVPMSTVEAAMARDAAGDWTIVAADGYTLAATVRVHFTAPHVVTDEECTVPAHQLDAVACWAAAELCRQVATQKAHDRDTTLSAANVSTGSASADLARRAKEWMERYRELLGLPDPAAKPGAAGAGALVSWRGDDRPRPRFYSLP